MTLKRKAAGVRTPHAAETNKLRADSTMRQRIKGAIVRAAIWGALPLWLADFLIQFGGMRHE
jgi:hypothetical protein